MTVCLISIVEAPEQHNFGNPTSAEDVSAAPAPASTITDKDAQIIPPAFGTPSAYMPGTGEALTPNLTDTGSVATATVSTSTAPIPASPGHTVQTVTSSSFDLPLYYDDGSLGRLKIPALGINVKVYETESLESLSKGVGHFKSTSAWNGNCAIAGHNRGSSTIFADLHTLKTGDSITYTTQYGSRTYEVYSVSKIKETDMTVLERSSTNILTLITCVKNQSAYRWCVVAKEV